MPARNPPNVSVGTHPIAAGDAANSAAKRPSIGVWKCTVLAVVKTAMASSASMPGPNEGDAAAGGFTSGSSTSRACHCTDEVVVERRSRGNAVGQTRCGGKASV